MFDKKRVAIAIVAVAMSLMCCAGGSAQTNDKRKVSEFAPVIVPPMPDKISFAGEEAPLSKFYIKESLMRELITNEYMHSRMLMTILNSHRYFSVIEPILKKNGIPEDFKYLCVTESNLDPNAVSSAGAAGLWQFMPATAKEYGLIVNKNIDERYNIEKATEAACRYLINAYGKLGNWTLVAASYNVGIGGVSRRLEQQHVKSYYDLVLPIETSRYVFRILAHKLMLSDPETYGYFVDNAECYACLDKFRTIEVSGKDIDWVKVALDNGVTYKELRLFNPWIRTLSYENKEGVKFAVKIPTIK